MALPNLFSRSRRRRCYAVRQAVFESLEHRNMPAVLIDVGHHLVEPNASGQTVTISVASTNGRDPTVAGFDLRAQIVTAKKGPYFEGVRFAGDLWNSYPHVESGSSFPINPALATGSVSFTQDFEARADGTLVTFTIDTTGIPAGSYEFRLIGTQLGNSSLRRTDGSSVSEIITNGTLQVRSIWQNPEDANDVNGDGRISPVDVLLLLNELSKNGPRELSLPTTGDEPPPYYDVNGDGFISPLDPLNAINCLNGLGCVTVPRAILAQVTPDFSPRIPSSTGAGKPIPDNTSPGDLPPGETDSQKPRDCVYYDLDEDGKPFPVIDPDFCEGIDKVNSGSITVEPDASVGILPPAEALIVEPLGGFPKGLGLLTSSASPAVVSVLPASSVDAAIVEVVDELSGEATSDELVDLGLGGLFAVT